jgi:hypothetical protein
MSNDSFPNLSVRANPDRLLSGLAQWRRELRQTIAASLSKMDPSAPQTLVSAVVSMYEAHYKPKTLSTVLGPSQTTIARWAEGATIPRSAPYRKWLVETLIAYLKAEDADDSSAASAYKVQRSRLTTSRSARPKRPKHKAGGLRPRERHP